MEQLLLFDTCKTQRCGKWIYWQDWKHQYCENHYIYSYLKKYNVVEYKITLKKIRSEKIKLERKRPQVKIKNNLKKRIKELVKQKRGPADYSSRIGMSSKNLRHYLEKKFHSGMDWTNYGKLWHVDHIKPIALFNLLDQTDIMKVNHYTNLQPMLAKDNLKKGKKYAS